MAFKLPGRVLESFTTTGTGTITLGGAVSGYRTFASALSNSDTTHYFMFGGSDWEEGYGTYTGGTLARTTVLASSNGGSAVSWAAGTKYVGVGLLGLTDLDALNLGRLHGAMGLPRDGYLYGLTLSNNASDATNDIDIAAGVAADSTAAVYMRRAAGITKRLDASWAVGSGNGGLDTGSIANATYHMWLIMRSDTGVVDVLFSTSASSPTMPANYDYKRRIGSIIRSGGAIVAFIQDGDDFLRSVPSGDVSTTNPGTAAVTATLSVPTGIVVWAMISATLLDPTTAAATPGVALFTSLDQADSSPTSLLCDLRVSEGTAGDSQSVSVFKHVKTNTSGQIRYRQSLAATDVVFRIVTHGWVDRRGRL